MFKNGAGSGTPYRAPTTTLLCNAHGGQALHTLIPGRCRDSPSRVRVPL